MAKKQMTVEERLRRCLTEQDVRAPRLQEIGDYLNGLDGWMAVVARVGLQKYRQEEAVSGPVKGQVYVGWGISITAPNGETLEHHPKTYGSYNRSVVKWIVNIFDSESN